MKFLLHGIVVLFVDLCVVKKASIIHLLQFVNTQMTPRTSADVMNPVFMQQKSSNTLYI